MESKINMESAILKHHQNLLTHQKHLVPTVERTLLDHKLDADVTDRKNIQMILKNKGVLQEEIDKTFGGDADKIALISLGQDSGREKSQLIDHLLKERDKEFTEMKEKSLAQRRELEKQKERLHLETVWLNKLSGHSEDGMQDSKSLIEAANNSLPQQEEMYKRLFEKQTWENEKLQGIISDAADTMAHEPISHYNYRQKTTSPMSMFYGSIAQLLMEEIILEETYKQMEQISKETLCLWEFIKSRTSSGLVRTVEAFVTGDPEGRPRNDPLHDLNMKCFRKVQAGREKIWMHSQHFNLDGSPEESREEDIDDSDTRILNFQEITPSYLRLSKVRRKDSVNVKLQKERYHRYKKNEAAYFHGFVPEINLLPIPKKMQGISMVRFSPDEKYVAVGSGHGDIVVFDTSWEPWREHRVVANRGKKHDTVVDLKWSLGGTRLLVVNKMGTLTMWTLATKESGKEDAAYLGLKEDVTGIVPSQMVPVLMMDADQRDFEFQRGSLVAELNTENGVNPVLATFDGTLTTFGTQNNFFVGCNNSDILRCEVERAVNIDAENFRKTTVINASETSADSLHDPTVEGEVGQNIPANLFKHHKSPLVLIDVVGGTGDVVSVDTRGRVILWKNRIKERTSQGWYRPFRKYRVDFSKKEYVPAPDAKSNVIFSAKNLAKKGKSARQISEERRKAMQLIENMKFGDPWHEELFEDGESLREIYKPEGSVSSSGAVFHVTETEDSHLDLYFTRLFKPVTVNCMKFLCCVMSPTKREIVFVLLFPQFEPKAAHITVVVLDLTKMSLCQTRSDIRIKDPEQYMNGDVVSCDVSRTIGITGTQYVFLNIKGNVYGISMATGQFVLKTGNPLATMDFEGLLLNSRLVNITPESEVAIGNVNGNLTLVSYAYGQKKSKDQRTMTVIKLVDQNSEENRKLMKGLHGLCFGSKHHPDRELRLEKSVYKHDDHIWADMMTLTLHIMDSALEQVKVIGQDDLEKFEKLNIKAGYSSAIDRM